ncbi:single-stranded DNA-binding protein [Brachybacterium saurashtrense]|uniref:Single-stranded DNA-binding protein n=1 Tax=Brachybacterium saurashtrense TaxID=556288 RepID=A0A345YNC4_9MICO|nr:single-stranded DNA-binding protein [Brachybacterium saurashtrense]AXK45426.1 single-stranded DNA-binding protein [Brachybacterium saurashtrense]RRR21817.1 single-stranded DNA-binding protein [Brachybacterium saurashtrense]
MRDIQTSIMGNATADPTAHRQEDGSVTAKLRIAVTGRYYNTTLQEYADRKTEFVTVFVRRQLARYVLLSVRKGQPLIVTGRLSTSEWTGSDGAPRHSLNVQAEAVGHDLTYGTAMFQRPQRSDTVPDIDPYTGEVVDLDAVGAGGAGSAPSTGGEPLSGAASADEPATVEEDLTPAPF